MAFDSSNLKTNADDFVAVVIVVVVVVVVVEIVIKAVVDTAVNLTPRLNAYHAGIGFTEQK